MLLCLNVEEMLLPICQLIDHSESSQSCHTSGRLFEKLYTVVCGAMIMIETGLRGDKNK